MGFAVRICSSRSVSGFEGPDSFAWEGEVVVVFEA